jgi:hypothetical protein
VGSAPMAIEIATGAAGLWAGHWSSMGLLELTPPGIATT